MPTKKTISVLLRKKVSKLGEAGQIKNVAVGYARNFLIPQKMVVIATPAIIAQSKALLAKKAAKEASDLAQAKQLADKIKKLEVVLRVKAGQKGKLFGAITAQKIAEALFNQHSIKINEKQISLSKPLKTLGKHGVALNLSREIKATLTVKTVSTKS